MGSNPFDFGFDPDEVEEFRREYFDMLERVFGIEQQNIKLREEKGSIRGTIPRDFAKKGKINGGEEVSFVWDPIFGMIHIDVNGQLKERDD